MVDLTQDAWSYVIALIDGGEWDDDYVTLYEMSPTDCGELCGTAYLVPKHTCPRCGREMTPHVDFYPEYKVWHECKCVQENK